MMNDLSDSRLARRDWVPQPCEDRVTGIAEQMAGLSCDASHARIDALIARNLAIHDQECFNLNPATNVMNPRAEAALAQGLGSRPSLGYPGDKYEMGLEAIEEIEVMAAALAARVFQASYAEIRVGSGALANLYAFMALTRPGDVIIAPPDTVGGHVTHHAAGCAGLYGLRTVPAPVSPEGYGIDVAALARLARELRPRLITIGGSLNLSPHPVAEIRAIADEVGAHVLFDAAHQCGLIAGRAWANPLDQGAHLMTMSTYKSLGGPAGGLIVTRDGALAERLDTIAFPGMTANFDAAKSAALAISLLDWVEHGPAYAQAMIDLAQALSEEMQRLDLLVFAPGGAPATQSHQFALRAAPFGGGQRAARHLRQAGFLSSGIGLPVDPVSGDMNGLRMGTPEMVRRGVTVADAPDLAALIADALSSDEPARLAPRAAALRAGFQGLHFMRAG